MVTQFGEHSVQLAVRSDGHVIAVVEEQHLLDELPDGVRQRQRVIAVPVIYHSTHTVDAVCFAAAADRRSYNMT